MADVKLGVVRLGRLAGKIKYTILDEKDVGLADTFTFEPRMHIDQDGNGAKIYAYAYKTKRGKSHARRLQDILWERHCGGVAPGCCVIHKNGITVDNRLENLKIERRSQKLELERSQTSPSNSIYYLAIQQLIPETTEERLQEIDCPSTYYNADGEVVNHCDENTTFYECHFPPCTNLEKEIREFSVCGHCQQVRYCGYSCQQKDWSAHKKYCRQRKRKFRHRSVSPER